MVIESLVKYEIFGIVCVQRILSAAVPLSNSISSYVILH